MKITRFRDIPMFTREGSWECDFSLDYALSWITESVALHELNLDPDFQRGHVWTESQQIAWMEFLLRGGKTGRIIYLNNPDWMSRRTPGNPYKEYVIVDGKQRVQAIREFLENRLRVFGSFYSEFTDCLDITRHGIKINVNTLQSRAEVLTWYIEFNSGGTPHSEAEIARVRELLEAERPR